jgi:hypothetical protein
MAVELREGMIMVNDPILEKRVSADQAGERLNAQLILDLVRREALATRERGSRQGSALLCAIERVSHTHQTRRMSCMSCMNLSVRSFHRNESRHPRLEGSLEASESGRTAMC